MPGIRAVMDASFHPICRSCKNAPVVGFIPCLLLHPLQLATDFATWISRSMDVRIPFTIQHVCSLRWRQGRLTFERADDTALKWHHHSSDLTDSRGTVKMRASGVAGQTRVPYFPAQHVGPGVVTRLD